VKRTVSAMEARRKLGELLESVYYRNDEIVIERNGKVMGVLVAPAQYQILQQNRQRLSDAIEAAWARQEGTPLGEEEAMALAMEAQKAARKQMRAEKAKKSA